MPSDKKTLALAIKARVIAQTWTGGSSVVFPDGAVRITQDVTPDAAMRTMRVPMAIITLGTFQSDPQHNGQQPDYLVGTVTIRIATAHRGDEVGELAIIGGHRGSDIITEGAGLLDLEKELFNAVGTLNTDEGVDLQFRDNGDSGSFIHGEYKYVGWQEFIFEAACTRT